jgi:hypothetical protein
MCAQIILSMKEVIQSKIWTIQTKQIPLSFKNAIGTIMTIYH